jgi:hypothetical protein
LDPEPVGFTHGRTGSLDEDRLTPILRQAAGGLNFCNHSFYDLRWLAEDSRSIELNFNKYLNCYSWNGGAPENRGAPYLSNDPRYFVRLM